MLNLKKGNILQRHYGSNTGVATNEVIGIADGVYLLDDKIWYTESEIKANFFLPKEKWVPKEGEKYWMFDCELNIMSLVNDTDRDKERIEIGNCFQTKAEAQKVVEEIKKILNK